MRPPWLRARRRPDGPVRRGLRADGDALPAEQAGSDGESEHRLPRPRGAGLVVRVEGAGGRSGGAQGVGRGEVGVVADGEREGAFAGGGGEVVVCGAEVREGMLPFILLSEWV